MLVEGALDTAGNGSGTTIYLILWPLTIVIVAAYLARVISEVPDRKERYFAGGLVAFEIALPVLAMTLKRFDLITILSVICLALLGVTAGTAGHPVRMFGSLLTPSTSMSRWEQVRVALSLLLFAAIGIPVIFILRNLAS